MQNASVTRPHTYTFGERTAGPGGAGPMRYIGDTRQADLWGTPQPDARVKKGVPHSAIAAILLRLVLAPVRSGLRQGGGLVRGGVCLRR